MGRICKGEVRVENLIIYTEMSIVCTGLLVTGTLLTALNRNDQTSMLFLGGVVCVMSGMIASVIALGIWCCIRMKQKQMVYSNI